MKKVLILVAVLFIMIGLALFGAAFVAFGYDFSKLDSTPYETKTYLIGENFKKIEIAAGESDITFQPSVDNKLHVVCKQREKLFHTVAVEGETLIIRTVDQRSWMDHLQFSFQTPYITMYLPQNDYDDLMIESDTGDVSIPGSFSFGKAEIHTDTGNVLCDACTDGLLKIETSTGDIRVNSITAKNLDLSVSTGAIEVREAKCKETVSVAVSTGKVTLSNLRCQNLYSTGSTGDISFKDTVVAESFQIKRSTGDIDLENCDADQVTLQTSTGDITGSFLTEKIFIAKTSTGEIDVPNTVSGGPCTVTTSTGDICLKITEH